MNPAVTTISIIIPTHNRAASARRLLDKLAHQTYSMALMEVIMVANDCKDDTVAMLQQYKAPYTLKYAETNGTGPAVPRNKGASMAEGAILIFLDDDVDPSEQLAEAHVGAHDNDTTVVIGYLPLAVSGNPGYYRLSLKMWWENKFREMSKPGYRFGYEDLLSGNFSTSADLFRRSSGFITTLSCRDDYELGVRLLNLQANFKFCKEAAGLHRDEVTDLNRSLKRKREEGRMDTKLWNLHPRITNSLQKNYRENRFNFLHSRRAWFMMNYPRVSDKFAGLLKSWMKIAERLSMRWRWHRLSYRLHTYWYYRGLMDALGSRDNLVRYFSHEPFIREIKKLDIDLEKGLAAAENLLDDERPEAITIWLGPEKIADLPYEPGMERLKGAHLRAILATTVSEPMTTALVMQTLKTKPAR
ncbi:MAG TPA: glycosyltransferase family 2 protein [Chitinophagaceae bacterium]|nr:glycosyltransferase family 2 protein [Chitinophagaceae bacterium]